MQENGRKNDIFERMMAKKLKIIFFLSNWKKNIFFYKIEKNGKTEKPKKSSQRIKK